MAGAPQITLPAWMVYPREHNETVAQALAGLRVLADDEHLRAA